MSDCDHNHPDEIPEWAKRAQMDAQEIKEMIYKLQNDMRRIIEKPTIDKVIVAEYYAEGDVNLSSEDNSDRSTNIAGSVSALAQSGAQQIVGSITQNINSLESNPETKAAANQLNLLAEAIKNSDKFPSERERRRYLEDLEELTTQAARPKAEREAGVVDPIIDRFAVWCGGVGGLAAVWTAAEPAIRALFS